MTLTDEQVIDAFLEEPSVRKAASRLGISNEALDGRLKRMRTYGVQLHKNKVGPSRKFTDERVRELNAYIQQKIQTLPR